MRTLFDTSDFTGSADLQEAQASDDELLRQRCRAIFISDLHLGTPGCQASALLDFLQTHPSGTLILVGGIVDGSQLQHKRVSAAGAQRCRPRTSEARPQRLLRGLSTGQAVVYEKTL